MMPNFSGRAVLGAAALFAGLYALACRPTAERPPNIVYILADDLGYGELGSYGQQKIRTPNLDRLASEGVRFTQHYSGSPVCAPSRGALLTGKHTGHAYVRDNKEMGGWGPDEPEGQLPLAAGEITIAEMLKPAGYATGFVGKWGLGGPESEGHPNAQGFDHFYGYLCQRVAHNYYPTHLWLNGERDSLAGNSPWFPAHQSIEAPLESEAAYYERFAGDTYAPDRMIDEALDFVRTNHDRPFFLVFATPVPHLALQVPRESLDEYRDSFDDVPYLGGSYLPHPYPRAAYAAMITRMDRDAGRLLDLLDSLGVGDDTIVLFSSDNGTTFSRGVEAAYFQSTSGLRGLKGSVFEGGIRVPMLARWRGRFETDMVTEHPSAFWDVMATVAEAAGVEPPEGIDGVSFLPVLLGEPAASPEDRPLYWEYHAYGGMQAVRSGRWKGIRLDAHANPDGPIALYDLESDPGESRDIAAEHPDVVARLDLVMKARSPSPIPDWNFTGGGIRP